MKPLKILSKKPSTAGNGAGKTASPPSIWESLFDAQFPSPFFGSWPDRFRPAFAWPALPAFKNPVVDVSEDDKEVVVKAEIPGLTDKDLEVSYADGTLYLKGEKKEEKEEKGKNTWHRESWQGSFTRAIPLGERVDWEKAEAKYKDGVLNVLLPKIPGKENRVKISVQ